MAPKMFENRLLQVFKMSAGPTSPVPHLLTSNVPATDEERATIQKSISVARERRDILNRALNVEGKSSSFWRLATVERTRRRIKALDNFIQKHELLVISTGILSLPIEILLTIFEMVVQGPLIFTEDFKLMTDFRAPCTLSHVCQHWRNMMLSTPRMWDKPCTVYLDDKSFQTKPYLHCLAKVLQRSHPRPISLMVLDSNSSSRPGPLHPALRLLLQFSERWDILILHINSLASLDQLSPAKGKLSSLRSLEIWFRGSALTLPSTTPPCNIFEVAPCLEHISLNNNPCDIAIPMTKITQITLSVNSEADSIRNLPLVHSCAASLTHLYFHIKSAQSMPSRTLLPHLVSLSIKFSGLSTTQFVDDIVAGPSLQVLVLQSASIDAGDVSRSALSLILRSKAKNIQRLQLTQPGALQNLFSVLEYTYFLRSLNVSLPHRSDLEALAWMQSERFALVPFLEYCCFTLMENISVDVIEPLHNLGMARCGNRTPLNKAIIHPDGSTITETGLKSLRLTFTSGQHRASTQIALEGWYGSNMANMLKNAANRLGKEASDAFFWDSSLTYRSKREKIKREKDLEEVRLLLHDILEANVSVADILVCISRYLLEAICKPDAIMYLSSRYPTFIVK